MDNGELNEEQAYILSEVVDRGRSICINGPGGTGKTFLTEKILAALRQSQRMPVACAPTGMAAQLLGVVTVCQLCGLIPNNTATITDAMLDKRGQKPVLVLTSKYKRLVFWTFRDAIKYCTVLICDELSMLSEEQFEEMSLCFQRVRKNFSQPFGGVQLIFVGDSCQLAPVGDPDKPSGRYCFESRIFKRLFDASCCFRLTTSMRQRGDKTFVDILNAMRVGKLSQEQLDILNERVFDAKNAPDKLSVTYGFCTNWEVEKHNKECMEELLRRGGPGVRVHEWDSFDIIPSEIEDRKKYELALSRGEKPEPPIPNNGHRMFLGNINKPQKLQLAVGALVKLKANYNVAAGYVNGALGTVVAILSTCQLALRKCLNPRCDYCQGRSPTWNETLMEFKDETGYSKGYEFHRFYPVVEFNHARGCRIVVMPSVACIKKPDTRKKERFVPKPKLQQQPVKRKSEKSQAPKKKLIIQSRLNFSLPERAQSLSSPPRDEDSQSSSAVAVPVSSSQPTPQLSALSCAMYADSDDDDSVPLSPAELSQRRPTPSPVVKRTRSSGQKMIDGLPASDVVLAAREQIPLELAWSSTFHGLQGSTLERLVVDPKGLERKSSAYAPPTSEASNFTKGMLYVACSRVKTINGLVLLRPIRMNQITVSRAAVEFNDRCVVATRC